VFEVRVVVEHAFFVRHKKVSHFQVVALHHEHRTAPHRTARRHFESAPI
jgi:hypothetical protein